MINSNKETNSVVGATLIPLSDFIDGSMKEIVEEVISGYVVIKYLTICEPAFVNVYGAQESVPRDRFRQPEACRVGTTNRAVVPASQAGNRFLGSLKGLQIQALQVLGEG
jgi:hypothetical protein